jgi:hypothetical protein
MRIRLNLRWLLVPALFFSLQLCRANNLTFNFDTNSAPLWDLSGLYSFTLNLQEPNGAVIPVSLAFNMRQDAAGNLHGFPGDFQSIFLDENSSFVVTNTISGSVRGNLSTGATARFVVHFLGFGGTTDQPQGPISATLLVDAAISPDGSLTLEPIKPIRFIAQLPHASVRGIDAVSTIPLPPGEDGSWTLNLQFDTFNRAIGAAIVTTPSQSLGFNLSGVFTGTPDLPAYKLKMIGSRAVANTVSGVGSTATIFLSSSSTDTPLDTIQINGRIMGQRITF